LRLVAFTCSHQRTHGRGPQRRLVGGGSCREKATQRGQPRCLTQPETCGLTEMQASAAAPKVNSKAKKAAPPPAAAPESSSSSDSESEDDALAAKKVSKRPAAAAAPQGKQKKPGRKQFDNPVLSNRAKLRSNEDAASILWGEIEKGALEACSLRVCMPGHNFDSVRFDSVRFHSTSAW
jgi:hypothetical protein